MIKKEVVLDTNVLIDIYRNKKLLSNFIQIKEIRKVYITSVVYVEFLAGAKLEFKRNALKFLADYPILSFCKKSEVSAKTISTQHQIKGKGKATDLLIAAVCIANNLPLLTANIDDFNFKKLEIIKYNV